MSPTGIAILSRLYRSGTATPKALADAEDAQPQTLTRVLATLEEQGLIGRGSDPTDRRHVLLDITPAGLAVLRRHAAAHTEWLTEAMEAELSDVEREVLRLAAALMDRLADHR